MALDALVDSFCHNRKSVGLTELKDTVEDSGACWEEDIADSQSKSEALLRGAYYQVQTSKTITVSGDVQIDLIRSPPTKRIKVPISG